jgi:hypothetical protein
VEGGYIKPWLNIYEVLDEFEISPRFHERNLKNSIDAFEKIELSNLQPVLSIREHICLVEDIKLLRLKGNILHKESMRGKLLKVSNSKEYLSKLTDAERIILDLAMKRNGNNFLYNRRDICELTAFTPTTVGNTFTRLAYLTNPNKVSYISSEGKRINSDTLQYELINMRPTLESHSLTVLSSTQRRFYDLIAIPDEGGRYMAMRIAFRKLGYKDKSNLARVIKNNLEDTEWLLEVKERFEKALTEDEVSLSDNHIRFLQYVLKCIENGISIGSYTSNGMLGVKYITNQLGITSRSIYYLKKKIGPF